MGAVAELLEATSEYHPNDHPELLRAQADPSVTASVESQYRWHDALDRIVEAANRLKMALGASGRLRPANVTDDGPPPSWPYFGTQFEAVKYPRGVRIGLRRLANAAIDLSGFAVVKQPPEPLRELGLLELDRGLWQVWPALTPAERKEVRQELCTARQVLRWPGKPTADPPRFDGPIEITAEEEYRVIDQSGGFYTRDRNYLNEIHQASIADALRRARERVGTPRRKRSTIRGEARLKLIACLTKHHEYAAGSCLNAEPINNNDLARFAGVDKATASAFFKKVFGGHAKYKVLCRDMARLVASLKHLNGEYTPFELFGRSPPGEDDEDEDE